MCNKSNSKQRKNPSIRQTWKEAKDLVKNVKENRDNYKNIEQSKKKKHANKSNTYACHFKTNVVNVLLTFSYVVLLRVVCFTCLLQGTCMHVVIFLYTRAGLFFLDAFSRIAHDSCVFHVWLCRFHSFSLCCYGFYACLNPLAFQEARLAKATFVGMPPTQYAAIFGRNPRVQ